MDPRTLRTELEGLRGRLRVLFVIYGTLRLVAIVAALLAIIYVLDRNLTLPAPVRLLFLAVTLGVGVLMFLRGVLYPLRQHIEVRDVACAVEERFPQFDGRLLSTLELEGDALAPERNVSLELVDQLRDETSKLRFGLKFEDIFDYRSLTRLGALTGVLLAITIGYAASQPHLTGIFFERILGGDQRWPQRTFLQVMLPEAADHFTVEYDGERPTRVLIARGASLPVTVRVEGENPRFVELRADSASDARTPSAALAPTQQGEWVGRFRSVRDSFEFRPVGGDDDGYGRAVAVEVFTPPSVAALETTLRFPPYTGLQPRTEPRGDVEAPIGTQVELAIQVAANTPIESGRVVFDGELSELALEAGPLTDAEADVTWRASFQVTESSAYSIHLVGQNGFRNLDPATYAVIAVRDRPPTVRLLEPGRADVDVTPQGVVPFRVAADDDYGVEALGLTLQPFGEESTYDFELLGDPEVGDDRKRRLVYQHVDLAATAFPHADGPRASQEGDSYVYRVIAADNHSDLDGTATPNETAVSERRVDVVSRNEKQRLLTERQIRHKDEVRSLRELQQEKMDRLVAALADYEATEGDVEPDPDDLAGLEIGQNQVTNRSVRLCRDFADLYEQYLLNRLDPSAAAERLIPILVERKRASTMVDGFDFDVYRPMVDAYETGSFGQLDVLGRLLGMLRCILDVSQSFSPEAAGAISDARLMLDANQRPAAIRRAIELQEQTLAQIDLLLEKMDEWEDFQEIITLFRDLLEDQRDLNARTKNALKSGNR